ncbi:sugar transferase [Rhodosalinus sediminis]|uniref:Sugar transferase n=1 Tax=Rhodosalinus sediminis TaxID=1940533 RepID=A0A3D9BW10_9RHOB|nr:sugar transferase [Rhodosalinus sediminis]REC57714.1 sugar transferase [Rhodosalinus sediminis]
MTPAKRVFDILVALALALLLAPVILAVAAAVRWRDGAPVLYRSERMQAPGRPFTLWKFRTMTPADRDSGVSGGDKAGRITPTGRVLRRWRLDELPQLWNVLRGDMSLVGPRPPLRRYVAAFPELYAEVLRARPGVTGLATRVYHTEEERLLAACRTPRETDAVYMRRCVPRKARLDRIYRARRTLCLDAWLMLATVVRRLPVVPRRRASRRRPRRRAGAVAVGRRAPRGSNL